jgi:hypothetical protein
MGARLVALSLLFAGVGGVFGTNIVRADEPQADNSEQASQAEEDLPVMVRPRPEFDPKGIRLGGFRLYPTLDSSVTYDSNIDRTQVAPADDAIINVAPSLRLKSQWADDMLEMYAGANSYNYLSHSAESLTDWNTGFDGQYNIERGVSVYAAGQFAELHELRSSPNTIGAQASANRYGQYHGELDTTVQPNRLGIKTGVIADTYSYQNAPLIGGGFLDNADRSFNEYQGFIKTFYDFSPGYSGFVRISYDTRQFVQEFDRDGLRRSSNGYRVDGGVDLQISHLLSGEVYIGYLNQDFIAPLSDVRGVDYSAQVDWLATPVLTVHFQAARTLTQVVLVDASVSDDKSIGVSADYELLRSVILQAHATFVDSSFPGITRHDQTPDAGAGVKTYVNRHVSLYANYDYSGRATNLMGFGFRDSLVTVGITVHD